MGWFCEVRHRYNGHHSQEYWQCFSCLPGIRLHRINQYHLWRSNWTVSYLNFEGKRDEPRQVLKNLIILAREHNWSNSRIPKTPFLETCPRKSRDTPWAEPGGNFVVPKL